MFERFELEKNDSDVRTEILAGITTFLSMMYIIVVNPAILSETGMSFSAVLTATVIVSAFSSIMMGLYAKNPIALAPRYGAQRFLCVFRCARDESAVGNCSGRCFLVRYCIFAAVNF